MPRKSWTPEEDAFLKRAFMEHSYEEMAEALDRSVSSVKCRAYDLKLRKTEKIEPKDKNNRICLKCKKELPKDQFVKNKSKKDGLGCWCYECARKYNQDKYHIDKFNNADFQKEKERILQAKEATAKVYMTCTKCGETKLGEEFGFLNKKLKRTSTCKKCRVKQAKEIDIKRIIEGKDW